MKVPQAVRFCLEYHKSNSRQNTIRAYEGKVPSNKTLSGW